ncbi:hypothetical protein [Mesorhizobium sp. M1399]|uniref:hypothetical protein n=1 Tax=Mesorhizobium sp. M1399 TaxID=2957096 RepID=UPI003338F55D
MTTKLNPKQFSEAMRAYMEMATKLPAPGVGLDAWAALAVEAAIISYLAADPAARRPH